MADTKIDVLQPGQTIRPKTDKNIACELVRRLYGLEVKKIFELNAYDDKNYHIICEEDDCGNPFIEGVSRDGYVLKIVNSLDSKKTDFIEGQTELLIFLNENKMRSPMPVRNLKNGYYSLETIDPSKDEKHVVRLLTYRPGTLLNHVEISDKLLLDVGRFTATLDQTLKQFHHSAYDEYRSLWMLSSVPRLKDFLYAVENPERRLMLEEIIADFDNEVMRNIDKFETGIIHGDLNEQNILVDDKGEAVIAVLDLGDSQKSCLIFELAIAICYMILTSKDISRAKYILEGYQGVRKLADIEKNYLKICVCARISQSLILGAYSHLSDPRNEYLLTTQKPGWAVLEELWPMSNEEVLTIWGLIF